MSRRYEGPGFVFVGMCTIIEDPPLAQREDLRKNHGRWDSVGEVVKECDPTYFRYLARIGIMGPENPGQDRAESAQRNGDQLKSAFVRECRVTAETKLACVLCFPLPLSFTSFLLSHSNLTRI